jgi:hypothetical protein
MLAMLTKVEQTIHRQGWDMAATLFTVHSIRDGALMAAQVPLQLEDPVEGFIDFCGDVMLSSETQWADQLTSMLASKPGICGFLISAEGYRHESMSPAERAALPKGMSLADVPGSKEARDLTIIDSWGRWFSVTRVRGEKPVATCPEQVGGMMYEGLLNMMRSVAVKLPPEWHDPAGLAAAQPISMQDVQAEYDKARDGADT